MMNLLLLASLLVVCGAHLSGGRSWRHRSVTVSCSGSGVEVSVTSDVFGTGVVIESCYLRLGSDPESACTALGREGPHIVFGSDFTACGAKLWITQDSLIYTNKLVYEPSPVDGIIRMEGFVLPVECHYLRRYRVSNGPVKPTWVPFVSSAANVDFLDFSMKLMTSNWQHERMSNMYIVGELIHLQASVRQAKHTPLRLFVDSCVATLYPAVTSIPRYAFLQKGCLMDAQLTGSKSTLRPRLRADQLQIQLESFRFRKQTRNELYIACHLVAVPAMEGVAPRQRACSFVDGSWWSVDGNDMACDGCNERTSYAQPPFPGPVGYPGRLSSSSRDSRRGWETETIIGPLQILGKAYWVKPDVASHWGSAPSGPKDVRSTIEPSNIVHGLHVRTTQGPVRGTALHPVASTVDHRVTRVLADTIITGNTTEGPVIGTTLHPVTSIGEHNVTRLVQDSMVTRSSTKGTTLKPVASTVHQNVTRLVQDSMITRSSTKGPSEGTTLKPVTSTVDQHVTRLVQDSMITRSSTKGTTLKPVTSTVDQNVTRLVQDSMVTRSSTKGPSEGTTLKPVASTVHQNVTRLVQDSMVTRSSTKGPSEGTTLNLLPLTGEQNVTRLVQDRMVTASTTKGPSGETTLSQASIGDQNVTRVVEINMDPVNTTKGPARGTTLHSGANDTVTQVLEDNRGTTREHGNGLVLHTTASRKVTKLAQDDLAEGGPAADSSPMTWLDNSMGGDGLGGILPMFPKAGASFDATALRHNMNMVVGKGFWKIRTKSSEGKIPVPRMMHDLPYRDERFGEMLQTAHGRT